MLEPIFSKAPKLDASTAQIFHRESYLLRFSLTTDEELNTRPLGLVAMYDTEDPTICTRRREHIKKFAELSIRDVYGYSLKEFLREPRHRIEEIYTEAEAWQKKKASEAAGANNSVEAQMRAAGIVFK